MVHYEQVEAELPVAGQDWPWGYPYRYPISGPAAKLREGALRCGIEMRMYQAPPPEISSEQFYETDPYGQPVARMDYTLTDNDKANMANSNKILTDILDAADAQDVLTIQRFAHLIGGARMGRSPQTSVADANQRAWAVPNLFLADGSVCPTQGSANPALTIMALASRLAERMASGAATGLGWPTRGH